jgi:Response regulator containing a CheY-like receiver domain and an HTH DNA-binding domain
MRNINIAIVALDTISECGLQSLLSNIFEINSDVFASLSELKGHGIDNYDIYITAVDSYISDLDFFMPRKAVTIIISNKQLNAPGLKIISRFSKKDDIIASIQETIDELVNKDDVHSQLTHREIDVLKLIVRGMINKEIADNLNISINTVLSHRKNISYKLGIKSVSGLSIYAMMNGYI